MVVVAVILAGLGLGYGGGRWWRVDSSSPADENPPPDALSPAPAELAERNRDAGEPGPVFGGADVRRRALLVGVTRFDHLPENLHLIGPANDARLMRRLLMESYQFPAEAIVTLTEDAGPARRPTRANIARAFRNLADQAREDDQVVILLSGHGDRQPESDPPHPQFPEPDGIDEIFLPADVRKGEGSPVRVPNAIIDDEIGEWLRAIAAKKAYVWIIFDCCHSGTMTRGTEVVRELPPFTLVPQEELDKARQRAARRQGIQRGGSSVKPIPFVPQKPSDYLLALYACRPHETTPESPQPPDSRDAEYHGLLTYTLADILTMSAMSKSPLTYRELVQCLQMQYARRPQSSPTPQVEGRGQDRVVMGIEQPMRSHLRLARDPDGYKVNAGDLYGLTPGSILAVDSSAGGDEKPKLLGHVRVVATRPFDATVVPCAYEGSAQVNDLPPQSTCRPVFLDYALRRYKVGVQTSDGQAAARQRLQKAVKALAEAKDGLVEYVEDPQRADWLVRLEQGKVQLVEASANRVPFALPGPEDAGLRDALHRSLEKVYRARNLIALAGGFEEQRYRGSPAVDVDVEVLRHKNPSDRGEVLRQPAEGWVFRPGDLISFRVHNKSPSLRLDVTLLIVGTDFQVAAYYPRPDEVGKSLEPGRTLDTPPPHGQIGDEPPFGPECLIVIATPARNPPVDFTALAQDGLQRTRAADRGQSLRSPLGELLEYAMYRSGSRRGLSRSFAEQHGMRVLNWRTEPRQVKSP
jgi:hypothetical protein